MNATKTNFENLRMCRLAEKLADKVWDLVGSWDQFARDTVGKQIVRAADSVGANIAEGAGRGNRRFVRTSRGSLYETKHWLRRAYHRKLLSKTDVEFLKPVVDELGPKLNAFLKSIGVTHISAPDPEMPDNDQPRTTDN